MVAEPSVFSVDAIAPVADLIDEVWQRYNDRLDLAGVIINRMPAVSAEAERQYEAIAKIVGRRAVEARHSPNALRYPKPRRSQRPSMPWVVGRPTWLPPSMPCTAN